MESLTVNILGRDYRLSCEPAERETLLAAVAHVDRNMQAIREQGKIVGTERIAVFAALNIAGELLSRRAVADGAPTGPSQTGRPPGAEPVADPEILRRMQAMDAVLETALASQEALF